MPDSQSSSFSSRNLRSSEEEDENEENHWGNKIQFILSTIGLAVGIENVWRFPGLAYKNGGSAFLIAYVTCGFVFGLPVMYAEFIMGQYTQANPAKTYYLYAPAFHGLGLAAILTNTIIAVFYAVVISWAMLYFGLTIGGQSYKWTLCGNSWNTENCIASKDNIKCYERNASLPYSFNGTCVSVPPENTMSGAEEFFINYVTPRSNGITEFGDFNYPVAGCLLILYVLCALTNIKGIKILGKLSYITVPLPYIVVLILFIRGMFLDGAIEGVKHFLFKPDMNMLLSFKTWVAAMNQTCFSLALGMGALISLASHNKKRNNCFRDALTVIVFDTLMSVIGGLAVFSILGYLAKQTGKEITKIVENGPSLVFIVYPEAIATMPAPWLWNALFFAMLFLLGFSSIVVIMAFLCSFIYTTFPSIKIRWILPILFSVGLCLSGMVIATQAGWYWFNLMAGFAATTSPFVVVFLELALLYVYGWKNFSQDLENIFGPKPKNCLSFLFSKQSPFFYLCWALICPAIALLCSILTFDREVPMSIGDYVLPIWAEITVPLPYIVVLILFIRGMFLDGAIEGVKHFLFKPDMNMLLSFKTWVAAMNQTCFSLALGMGALISLASHNKKRNNCFRDALTVIVFDTLMSVIGGLAVFSILGYLAKQTGKEITKIVENGPSLVFIVYPEAIATMPAPWLWNALFFAMLFLLGFSSIVVIMAFLCSFIYTTFPSIKIRWILPILFSVGLCLSGMVIATQAGWYWFNLMAGFAATTSPFVVVFLELALLYVYGWKNFSQDLENIFGPKPKNCLSFLFSKQSPFFYLCWALICPAIALLCSILTFDREVPMSIGDYVLPIWAEVFGWFLNLGPILTIPVCTMIQYYRLKKKGLSLVYLIRPAEEHPSHDRIYRRKDVSSTEGFYKEESTTDTYSS